ncbi:MAG: hypothetical protein PVH19_07020 [Planctomycetia bacterium]|jgi:hypothetical protein
MFFRRYNAFWALLAFLISISACLAKDQVKDEAPKKLSVQKDRYLRIAKDADGESEALQTAIIRLVPKDPKKGKLVVDLVGAIHVAEPEYYDQLNREFDKYDAVLYELVAPEGTRPEQGRNKNVGVLGSMQHGLTDLLDLEHQLEGIDYKRDHFVHADLSPAEFAKSMRERKESVFGYAVRLFAASSAQQAARQNGSADDMAVLGALFSKNRGGNLKRAMAPQFVDMEMTMLLVDGPKGSTLISARNQKALDILKEQIGEGKKKIAIFYGAGHLPDLERRAIKQFDLKRGGETRWLEAWDLRAKEKEEKKEAADASKPTKKAG